MWQEELNRTTCAEREAASNRNPGTNMQEMKQSRLKRTRYMVFGYKRFQVVFFSPEYVRQKHSLFRIENLSNYAPEDLCIWSWYRKKFKVRLRVLAVGGDGGPFEDVVVQPADLGHSYCTFGSYNLRITVSHWPLLKTPSERGALT